ncbi:Hsp20/alpha crystallin family protein [Leptolyngbya sp. PCC 6406]|uniref:Hsp20/alpha crystallin family protein n=1 Tax=Leptolyngbya sp. PCC 6406 TaxID=1173264 RepID=UPI0002ABB98A|nr:Hsp20/alpha crystallin family protein [Leptolyngbya sp. PCC 6406]
MIVRYWQPFQEVETLRRQLDQVFEDITNVVDPSTTTWTPAIRLVESGDTYRLTVQLAGVNADDLDVQVTRESVLLSGKRQAPEIAERDRILYENIHYGAFQRVVNLPNAVQNEAVTAEFNQGLLTLTLPKVEAARNKVVKINLSST